MYFATLSEIRNIMKWPKDYEKYGNLVSGTIARGSVGYVMMPITVVKVRYEASTFDNKSWIHVYISYGFGFRVIYILTRVCRMHFDPLLNMTVFEVKKKKKELACHGLLE